MRRRRPDSKASPRGPVRAPSRGGPPERGPQRPLERPAERAERKGEIGLTEGASAAVLRGHPWIFAEQARGATRNEVGDVVIVRSARGEAIGRAIVDPESPLVARVYTRGLDELVDVALFARRIERARALRASIEAAGTTAVRVVNGEGDRLPGVVIDRYDHVAVLRLDGAAMARWCDRVADAAFGVLSAHGVTSLVLRETERGAEEKIRLLRGEPPPAEIVVREHGVPFLVDLARGQKTGAFLDQRENRRRVGALARGKRVLNLFSYAGGFSLHAALGGATEVTSVDVAAGAHATAQRSFAVAGVDPGAHLFVTADVFRFLERAVERRERWDVVISDPPNMAPSAAKKPRAIEAYRRLHAGCAAVLADGGILCAASCSSHVSQEEFLATLDDATLGRADLRVLEIGGAGADHPTIACAPEGRYLEMVFMG